MARKTIEKKPKEIPIIESRNDIEIKMRRTHNLTLRPNLTFTGIKLLSQAFVKTDNGTMVANKGDWIVLSPGGGLYVINQKEFKYIFETALNMGMVGEKCLYPQCKGIYGKEGGHIKCSKCGDEIV